MARAQTQISPDAVIDALMAELALRSWGGISLADVARRVGMSLATLRSLYPSTGAILGAFARRIDLAVLEGVGDDLASEPVRERLFDLTMRRLDALAPYRDAMRNLRNGLRRDPFAARAWNRICVTSQQWTLAAAGVQESGLLAAARAQMLALAFARVLDAWLDDRSEDQARTLRALDRELGRLERCAETTSRLMALASPLCRPFHRREPDEPSEAAMI